MIKPLVRKSGLIFLSCAFFIMACDKIDFFSRPYVATVNEAKIYLNDYQTRLAQKKAMLPKEVLADQSHLIRLQEEVLDSMITEKIIYLRAQELNLAVDAGELEKKLNEIKQEYGAGFNRLLAQEQITFEQWKDETKKDMLFEKLIKIDVNAHIRVSETEIEDYFEENRDRYKMAHQVRAAQIVVRDQMKAQQLWKRLQEGEEFAKVAQEASIGPEARQGGDLGFITRQVLPDPLDKAIFSLPVNKISPIVRSPYGFHIFKVLEIKPAKKKTFEESKDEIMADLRAKKEEAAFISWLEKLKVKAVIKKKAAVLRNKIE